MKKVLFLVVVVVAVAAVMYSMRQKSAVKSEADRLMTKLYEDGKAKYPDALPSEALQKQAVEAAGSVLKSQADDEKRREMAASMFFGFYLINTRSRVEYCNGHDVDISAFTSSFANGHTAELASAQAAFANQSMTLDQMYKMIEPQMKQMVSQDMTDVAQKINTSPKGACEYMAANGPAFASNMHISKMQPEVYKILRGS